MGLGLVIGDVSLQVLVSPSVEVYLSIVRFGVMGLIKHLFLNIVLFDPSRQIWYWQCGRISTTILS